jgi:hypothetical protein
MQTTHLISSPTVLASGQAPVIVQVHAGHGLDLIAVAVGGLVTVGVLLALAGTRLLLRRETDTRKGGEHP